VLVAESYGGRDEPVDTLTRTFLDVGITPIGDPLRVKEDPTEATYQVLHALVQPVAVKKSVACEWGDSEKIMSGAVVTV
jgi:flavorubredoxin